ncbi:MAG: DUF1349 domain-containing protein [Sphaerochaetaceae bacterium]
MDKSNREWYWLNEPQHTLRDGVLKLTCASKTDFWQRTHEGFRRDNGHALLTKVKEDFSLTVRCEFLGKAPYDQAGVMVRIDGENWIKSSIEWENEVYSRLGSVVTNLGYSDWATRDIPSDIAVKWYRVQSRASDIFIQTSDDGKTWEQLRVAHLHAHKGELAIGLYACSPHTGGCEVTFSHLEIGPSTWQ